MRTFIVIAICFVLSDGISAAEERNVVLISVDGLRADVVTGERMPNLSRLLETGAGTLQARSLPPTFTIPNHVSMLTGLSPATHGVTDVVDTGAPPVNGTIIEIAHEAGLRTGVYLSKLKLRVIAKEAVCTKLFMSDGGSAEDAVAELLKDIQEEGGWGLTFLHIADPDTSGHRDGWMSEPYLAGVTRADEYIGRILRTLEETGLAQTTVVIVTADHGGIDLGHAAEVPEVQEVPWIAAGPGVPGRRIEQRFGLDSTASTILRILAIEPPAGMEGVAIEEVISAQPLYRRGDLNTDARVDLTDCLILIDTLIGGGLVACELLADANGDHQVVISDAVYLLHHLFLGGPPPPHPYPDCGSVESMTGIGCSTSCPH